MDFMKRRWAVGAAIAILALGVLLNKTLAGMKEPPKEDPPKSMIAPVAVAAVRECALCDHAAAVVLSVSLLCNRFNTTKNALTSFF